MKAIGYTHTGPITAPDSLVEFEAPMPKPGPRDLLVEVKGISVNPVDVKVRMRPQMGPEKGQTKIIGYDAAGIVREVGNNVRKFKIGDEVFYAGDITRPGTNSKFHTVDERIVGRKPSSLDFAEAAGMPLTSITSWELLFNTFDLKEGEGAGETLLIIGAAGGVGSILIQLAKKLTRLTVVATASRSETVDWVKKMGADHAINHHESLADQMKQLHIEPRYVASLNGTENHLPAIAELIQPRGQIALIDDPKNLDVTLLKPKSLSLRWEFMFTRSMFQTTDIEQQSKLLNRVSELIDNETLISTVNQNLGELTVENLKRAHALQENGRVIGKNVLYGFA